MDINMEWVFMCDLIVAMLMWVILIIYIIPMFVLMMIIVFMSVLMSQIFVSMSKDIFYFFVRPKQKTINQADRNYASKKDSSVWETENINKLASSKVTYQPT